MTLRAPKSTTTRLLEHLLPDEGADPMADELLGWLTGSRRFRAFAEAHRDKIRKKLRAATEQEARRDVRAELRAAHLMLSDRRFELDFEAYGSTTAGPDFSVRFRGTRAFNLEVTRPRRPEGVGRALLAKIRQLPTSVPNAVLIAVEGEDASAVDVESVTRGARARAEAKDDAFFVPFGISGARVFHERYARLGAVIVWCERASGDARAAAWTNPSARIPVPDQALRACLACFRASQPMLRSPIFTA